MIDLMPNGTILYQWVVFIVALLILNFGIFRPALKVIMARRSATEGDEQKAAEYEQKITELRSRVEADLDRARSEGQEIIQQLRNEAEATSSQTIREARERMESSLNQVRSTIEKESKEAELQLKQHAQSLAENLAQRVLGRNLT